MQAVILAAGEGKRLRPLTEKTHKCLLPVTDKENLLSLQIQKIKAVGIRSFVIITGSFASQIESFLCERFPKISFEFVRNEHYHETNYIVSWKLAKEKIREDILLLHADLVFDETISEKIFKCNGDMIVVDSLASIKNHKDFTAKTEGGRIFKIALGLKESTPCWPFYRLTKKTVDVWMSETEKVIREGGSGKYAEDALNKILKKVNLQSFDIRGKFCMELDTFEDFKEIKRRLAEERRG